MDFGAVNEIAFTLLPWFVGFVTIIYVLWVIAVRQIFGIKFPSASLLISMWLAGVVFACANSWLFALAIWLIRGYHG